MKKYAAVSDFAMANDGAMVVVNAAAQEVSPEDLTLLTPQLLQQ